MWKYGNVEIQKQENMEIWKYRNREIGKYGFIEIWDRNREIWKSSKPYNFPWLGDLRIQQYRVLVQ